MEVFPARAFGYEYRVEITLPQVFGGSSRLWLRNFAKVEMPKQYFSKIILDAPVTGRANDGQEIQIDNLGKWLFGTPGYMGHLRTRFPYGESATISVEIASGSPETAKAFLLDLKERVERG